MNGNPDDAISLFVVPTICEPLSFQPVRGSVQMYSHLRRLQLADDTEGLDRMPVDVLVGCDHYWDFVTVIVRRGRHGELVAIQTKLGWALSGETTSAVQNTPSSTCNVVTLRVEGHQATTNQLESQLREFWELEAMGIQEKEGNLYDDFTDTGMVDTACNFGISPAP